MTSIDGSVAWALMTEGGGQWRHAGMDGAVVGLDIGACLARPQAAEADPEALEILLLAGEAAALAALRRRESESD